MNKSASIGAWCLVALVVVLVAEVQDAAAVNCSELELSMCYGAIQEGKKASPQCCAKLKEQQPCICGYIGGRRKRSPEYKSAKEVARECGITTPQC